jgi:hypothetical protein
MLGGLAKANTWVTKPEGHRLLPTPPLEMLGAWLKANLRVIRPEEITPNEHKSLLSPPSMLGQKRLPDLSPRLHPRAPASRKPPR